MRLLVLLLSLAMPLVAWLSNSGRFGPDNGTVSDRYPTLLVAAGYAFAIWGVIFLLDVVHGFWQSRRALRDDPTLAKIAPWTAAGFALTSAWMPLFSLGASRPALFWLCLLVIFAALFCLLYSARILSLDDSPRHGQWLWAWTPLSLHAGWLSLASFLNLAQVIVAFKLLPTDDMTAWSLAVLALAAGLLLWMNQRMRGNIDYALAALWGLVAVWVKQSRSDLPGADALAWAAAGVAILLVGQTLWLRMRHAGGLLPGPARAGRD